MDQAIALAPLRRRSPSYTRIDLSRVPALFRRRVLLVSIRFEQAGVDGHALAAEPRGHRAGTRIQRADPYMGLCAPTSGQRILGLLFVGFCPVHDLADEIKTLRGQGLCFQAF